MLAARTRMLLVAACIAGTFAFAPTGEAIAGHCDRYPEPSVYDPNSDPSSPYDNGGASQTQPAPSQDPEPSNTGAGDAGGDKSPAPNSDPAVGTAGADFDAPLQLIGVEPERRRFCLTCSQSGVRVFFTVNRPATLTVSLRKRTRSGAYKPAGEMRVPVTSAGARVLTFYKIAKSKAINPGVFRATVQATDAFGAVSAPAKLRFRLTQS